MRQYGGSNLDADQGSSRPRLDQVLPGTIAGSRPKSIDRQGAAYVSCAALFPVFERNSGPVGDFHYRIEGCDRRARIDEACITHGAPHSTANGGEPRLVVAEHGVDELHEHHAVRHATVRVAAADDRR